MVNNCHKNKKKHFVINVLFISLICYLCHVKTLKLKKIIIYKFKYI